MAAYHHLRERGRPPDEMAAAFSRIEPFNFSTQILQPEADTLVVAELREVNWNDWGTPEGVRESLGALGWEEKLPDRPPKEMPMPRRGSALGV